jgi:hypothetical protein
MKINFKIFQFSKIYHHRRRRHHHRHRRHHHRHRRRRHHRLYETLFRLKKN